VIFLHLPIWETCSRQGDLLQTYYKISSLIIHYLGAFAVGEATAIVRRTQLVVVRRKCTNSRVTRKQKRVLTANGPTFMTVWATVILILIKYQVLIILKQEN
jgi:hypothetical protein